jgi:hypothetical protein
VPYHGSEGPHRERETDRALPRRHIQLPVAVDNGQVLVEGFRAELALLDTRHHDQLAGDRANEHGELFPAGKTGSRIADTDEQ